jgi:hypothetical protein
MAASCLPFRLSFRLAEAMLSVRLSGCSETAFLIARRSLHLRFA